MDCIELNEKIRLRRKQLGLTLEEVGNAVGVGKSTVRKWENGDIKNMRRDKIQKLAKVLQTTPAYLMGWDDQMLPSNVTPLPQMQKVPLLGRIACGDPILAEQNLEDYVDLPRHIRADYALTCKGDSMIAAGIRDGDIVYIRQQEQVENGQIAAVLVDEDEATLKRFYFDGGIIQLVAENPRIPPKVFVGDDVAKVRVIGLAVAYTHVIE